MGAVLQAMELALRFTLTGRALPAPSLWSPVDAPPLLLLLLLLLVLPAVVGVPAVWAWLSAAMASCSAASSSSMPRSALADDDEDGMTAAPGRPVTHHLAG